MPEVGLATMDGTGLAFPAVDTIRLMLPAPVPPVPNET